MKSDLNPYLPLVPIALCALVVTSAFAAVPLEQVQASPDTWADLGGDIIPANDVAFDDVSGPLVPGNCGVLCAPRGTNLDAYERITNETGLASYDVTVDLPAKSGGTVTFHPGDVAFWDFNAPAGYTVVFDASAAGVPDGVNTDAVALVSPGSTSSLLLSFDVTVTLGGTTYHDEDLVSWNGGTSFSLAFDGSVNGVAVGLDLDAAYRLNINGNYLLSFDGGGRLGGVDFFDDDLLEFGAGSWEMAYDGSAQYAGWMPTDLDAASATPRCDAATLGQTMVASSPTNFGWPTGLLFRWARGNFTSSSDIGNYIETVNLTGSGNGFTDSATPSTGTGYWYLVRPDCPLPLTSWQTSVGAEPARDANLP